MQVQALINEDNTEAGGVFSRAVSRLHAYDERCQVDQLITILMALRNRLEPPPEVRARAPRRNAAAYCAVRGAHSLVYSIIPGRCQRDDLRGLHRDLARDRAVAVVRPGRLSHRPPSHQVGRYPHGRDLLPGYRAWLHGLGACNNAGRFRARLRAVFGDRHRRASCFDGCLGSCDGSLRRSDRESRRGWRDRCDLLFCGRVVPAKRSREAGGPGCGR